MFWQGVLAFGVITAKDVPVPSLSSSCFSSPRPDLWSTITNVEHSDWPKAPSLILLFLDSHINSSVTSHECILVSFLVINSMICTDYFLCHYRIEQCLQKSFAIFLNRLIGWWVDRCYLIGRMTTILSQTESRLKASTTVWVRQRPGGGMNEWMNEWMNE